MENIALFEIRKGQKPFLFEGSFTSRTLEHAFINPHKEYNEYIEITANSTKLVLILEIFLNDHYEIDYIIFNQCSQKGFQWILPQIFPNCTDQILLEAIKRNPKNKELLEIQEKISKKKKI